MLYLIKSGKYIKIGFTDDFNRRYKSYLTDNPNVLVLGLRNGTKDTETKYHNILKNKRHRNEWFEVPEHIIKYLVTHHFTIEFRLVICKSFRENLLSGYLKGTEEERKIFIDIIKPKWRKFLLEKTGQRPKTYCLNSSNRTKNQLLLHKNILLNIKQKLNKLHINFL